MYQNIEDCASVNKEQTGELCRLLLRENIGANVFYEEQLEIFIGYDYLMDVHCLYSIEEIIPQIEAMGLYVEISL
ncbi:hypothetical protein [Listeria grandensis]|uniref:hypothetical protein n=1 Tax=Listeria grandensis TaxID=1494963 RepID=UPI00131F2A82|nr:hypothetical protein [Listeria grandensis]